MKGHLMTFEGCEVPLLFIPRRYLKTIFIETLSKKLGT